MDLLQRCREQAHKYYCDLLIAAERTTNDALFAQAEQCTSNKDQRRFYEAMQELKQQSDILHTTFREELTRKFQAFLNNTDIEADIDDQIDMNTLSLVRREELEVEIAISVIVSKANSRNSEALWKLNRRLALLRGGKTVTDETNPFGPAAVCQALQVALGALTLDSQARILIYKQLGKIFIISFAKQLGALNKLLVDGGILPHLRFTLAKSESRDTAGPSGNVTPAAEKLVESGPSIANQQQLYRAIRDIQARTGPRTHTAGGVSLGTIASDGIAGVDSFVPMDYVRVLSAIHQSETFLSTPGMTLPLSIEAVEEELLLQLEDIAKSTPHQKMTSDDADTVDLVGMIFRYMLDDPNLHDSVKSLLSHLHTPYLKLGLMDKTFLENYQHSARLLLNTLADVGGRWVKEDNDRYVLPKIKSVVEAILSGFVDDVSLFDRLLDSFSRYKENLEKRATMVEKRNTEAQQGLERLELARQKAGDELDERLLKAGISEPISDLLRRPWTEFLAFNLLRHGEDSLTWQSALKVLDGVIWSVHPGKATPENREDFYRRQADLEKTVSEGLSTIGYDPEASKHLLSALAEAHERACYAPKQNLDEGDKASSPTTDNKPDPDRPDSTPAASAPEQQPPVEDTARPPPTPKSLLKPPPPPLTGEEAGMVEKLKEIAFGTWFEFDSENSVKQLKLAWFSRVTTHYMFVDQTGVKQAVKTQLELARGMCAGTVKIVKPTKKSFMERALGAVLEKLKLA